MRYLRVAWDHDEPDDPIALFSELDDDSREVRKVEVFRDGRMGFADARESSEATRLGLAPVPDLAEIALSSEFRPAEITREEFDRAWDSARSVVRSR